MLNCCQLFVGNISEFHCIGLKLKGKRTDGFRIYRCGEKVWAWELRALIASIKGPFRLFFMPPDMHVLIDRTSKVELVITLIGIIAFVFFILFIMEKKELMPKRGRRF